jgi:hypothetical protein
VLTTGNYPRSILVPRVKKPNPEREATEIAATEAQKSFTTVRMQSFWVPRAEYEALEARCLELEA